MQVYNNIEDTIVLDGDFILRNLDEYFLEFIYSLNIGNYLGWKFTIIGKTIEDSEYLLSTVGLFLAKCGISFKSGTEKLVNCENKEQSKKLMTVYMQAGFDVEQIEQDIKHLLAGYTGHEGISLQYSTHIEGALYKRVDMDECGNYVAAGPNNY